MNMRLATIAALAGFTCLTMGNMIGGDYTGSSGIIWPFDGMCTYQATNQVAIGQNTCDAYSLTVKAESGLDIAEFKDSTGGKQLEILDNGNVLVSGGSSSTGCTVTGATGAFACTAGLTGTVVTGSTSVATPLVSNPAGGGTNTLNSTLSAGADKLSFTFGTAGSGTEKASLAENGDFTAVGALAGSNFSGSMSGTNTGDQTMSSGTGVTVTPTGTNYSFAVDQAFAPTWTGAQAFTPSGTNSVTITSDADSFLILAGLQNGNGKALCEDTSHHVVDCQNAAFAGSVTGKLGVFSAVSNLSAEVFTGAGLNDATSSGTYLDVGSHTYTVIIDATGTPDTFEWKKDSGSFTTGVAITGAAQDLMDGVRITFAATTGHTMADQWVSTGTGTDALQAKGADAAILVAIQNSSSEPTVAVTGDVQLAKIFTAANVTACSVSNAGTLMSFSSGAGAVDLCFCQQAATVYSWAALNIGGTCP